MPSKEPKKVQSPQADNKSKNSTSWGVIILLTLFFFPIGLYLLVKRVATDNNFKLSDLSPEARKKLMIVVAVVVAVSLPVSGIVVLVINLRNQADIEAHSISIDNAEGGEITVNCNIIDGSRNCEQIRISGTYTNGQNHYAPITDSDDVEISLKGDNGFYLSYDTTLDSSTSSIQDKSIKLCFSDSITSHYCPYRTKDYPTYNLIVKVNVSDEDRQKVKALEEEETHQKEEEERKKQEEEEARKAAQSGNNSSPSSSNSGSSLSSSGSNSNSSTKYLLKIIKDGESCPSNAKFCNISGKSDGYTSYSYGHMRGKLINNSGKDYSYLQITADVYNSSGVKIGDCLANTSGLKAGETWEYEAYCNAWSDGVSLKNGEVSGW